MPAGGRTKDETKGRKERKRGRQRTQVYEVTDKVLLELSLIESEDGHVAGVSTAVDVVANGGRPVEVAHHAIVGVTPAELDDGAEILESGDIILDAFQLLGLGLHRRQRLLHLVRIVRLGFRLQRDKLLGELLSVPDLLRNQSTSLVEDLLEAATATVANVLLGIASASAELVVGVDVGRGDVLVRQAVELAHRVPLLVLENVEVETKSALAVLRVLVLLLGRERNAEDGTHAAADVGRRVGVVDDLHHRRRAGRALHRALNPVDSQAVDAVLGKSGDDVVVGVAAGDLGRRARVDGDEEGDVLIDSLLPVRRRREPDRDHGGDFDAASGLAEEGNDVRGHRELPRVSVEDGVPPDSVDALFREGGVAASAHDTERTKIDVRAVEKGRVVNLRDAGQEEGLLPVRDEARRAGDSGGGRGGRRDAEGGRERRGGRRRTIGDRMELDLNTEAVDVTDSKPCMQNKR